MFVPSQNNLFAVQFDDAPDSDQFDSLTVRPYHNTADHTADHLSHVSAIVDVGSATAVMVEYVTVE